MGKRRRDGLEDWEVSIIKGMMTYHIFKHDQEILALFTRPGRTVNHGRLSEIRRALGPQPLPKSSQKYANQPVATRDKVE